MKEKKICLILVGAGFMGSEHLRSVLNSSTVRYIGIVDQSLDLARSVAEKYKLACYSDLALAIDECKPDAVDICTPTPFHRETIRLCAEKKVHVLCEKPIARTDEDAQAIEDLVRTSGMRLMVAQVVRFWPEYRYARDIFREKRYGELFAFDCKRLSSPPSWNSWMQDASKSGGVVVDLQIHDVDYVSQLLGTPLAVGANGFIKNGSITAVYSQLFYPSNIPVFVEASWLMPKSFPFRSCFKMTFEKAVVEMDSWRPEGQRLRIFPNEGEAFCPELKLINPYQAEIEYFAHQVSEGLAFDEVPLEESLRSLGICLASERACRARKQIEMGMAGKKNGVAG